jgi:hypothetical protein
MMPESKTSRRRLNAAARQNQALALRLEGKSFEVIASLLGYAGKPSAYAAVQSALARIPATIIEDYRLMNLERLNFLRSEVRKSPDLDVSKLVDLELSIQQEEAKLLGLYAHPLPGNPPSPTTGIELRETRVISIPQSAFEGAIARLIQAGVTIDMSRYQVLPDGGENGHEENGR